MPKINKQKILKVIVFILCVSIVIAVPVLANAQKSKANSSDDITVLSLWQIDSFEGGKGSRAGYLQNVANEFSKKTGCYVVVTSLTADAARYNLQNGSLPDLISYGAGMYGIESYLSGEKPYYTWCHGGYCLLTLDTNSNFEDVSAKNLVINGGTDNFVDAAALLYGVNGADKEKPTGAYVKLISGEYKFLLGTQRDIYRLKTRSVAFSVKPITQFNDLYQNISVTAMDAKNKKFAEKFINTLLSKGDKISSLGLMVEGKNLHDDEMRNMEGLTYENRLNCPISENTKNEIEHAISNCDVKKLKNLLN